MKINSLQEACEKLGYDINNVLPDVSKMPEKKQRSTIAFAALDVISEAAREGKEPDWNDRGQRKWFAWWDMEVDDNNPTGFRFLVSTYSYAYSITGSGSRLCFFSEEDCKFHAEKFIDLYRDMMVIPK